MQPEVLERSLEALEHDIPAARTCLNLCLVSLRLPSSSRFGDLLPIISYLRASQGRRAVKIPTLLDSCSNVERDCRDGVFCPVSENQVVDIGENQLYLDMSKLHNCKVTDSDS